jgi:hypothetical protein
MRVTSKLFQSLYLAPRQLLLSARSVKVVYELFTMLDVVGEVSGPRCAPNAAGC